MELLVFYIVLAIGVSFMCSILEATLLSITPAAVEAADRAGKRWAKRMSALKGDINRPLAAILALNTIANTMGAAGAGAEYGRITGNTGEAIFAGCLTLAILMFAEIIPKTLGATYATKLAAPASLIIGFLMRFLGPLVWLSRKVTTWIVQAAPFEPAAHREEILALARIGEQSGSLGERESHFVHNLMQLNAMRTGDIMTPRPVIFALPESTTLVEFVKLIEDKPFTRIPVYRESLDDMAGFVIRGEALLAHLKDDDDTGTLAQIARPLAATPEHGTVDQLFQRFIAERHQIMVVCDEFGTTVGLVSFEDVIETIFGIEIMDEQDKVADWQHYARELWRERAKRMGIELPAESQSESTPHS
ncbi:MAG: CNNM domain-containing protein [Luteolibacter sp.]|jgi:CBS domain containing-hemolysin-like protein